jgi:hypothetical protein
MEVFLSHKMWLKVTVLSRLIFFSVQEPGDGHSDSSLETESFLRTTESVVTAMQARMSFSLDSGGESDVDTSHSYQAPPSSSPGGGGMRQDLFYLVLVLWFMPPGVVCDHPGLCPTGYGEGRNL